MTRFTISPKGAAGIFLRYRCGGNVGIEEQEALGRLIEEFGKKAASDAYQHAKDIYREHHSGGCRMFSKGESCNCFLCRMDELSRELSE